MRYNMRYLIATDMEGEPLMWIFVGFQYFVFAFMALFSYLVDDIPEEVTIQLARQQFVTDKVLRMVPDEIEDLNIDMVAQPLVVSFSYFSHNIFT